MSDWCWSRWSSTSYQSLWSLVLCLVILLLFKAPHWPDLQPKSTKAFPDGFFFFFCTRCVVYVFPWVRLYQQISTAGTAFGSLVSSHARCFLCRSVSWAELSWSLWCSSLPILCRYPQPGDRPPRWASRSLHLNPAVSYKHIYHCWLLQNRWTAIKTKTFSRRYCPTETVSWWVKASDYCWKYPHALIAYKSA